MSKLGKKPIVIPKDTKVKVEGGKLILTGPKGSKELKIKLLKRQKLPDNFISDSTFRTYLKQTHSYKRGKCIGAKVNEEYVIDRRFFYASWWLTYHKAGYKFVFIDE